MPCLPLLSVCKLTSRPCLISPGTEALQLLDPMGSLICASLAVASCWESRKNDFFCCWWCSWDLNTAEWSEMYRVREGFLGTSGSLALLEHDYLMTLLPSFPPLSSLLFPPPFLSSVLSPFPLTLPLSLFFIPSFPFPIPSLSLLLPSSPLFHPLLLKWLEMVFYRLITPKHLCPFLHTPLYISTASYKRDKNIENLPVSCSKEGNYMSFFFYLLESHSLSWSDVHGVLCLWYLSETFVLKF